MGFRIGFGVDVHRLIRGRKLILGGVEIPAEKGLLGHSDADVLIHAICDALLGAASLRDIGFHFPDSDPQFKNADSRVLLKQVKKLLDENHWSISNIDSTIAMQVPKISPFVEQIRQNLAEDLGIEISAVSVKATTTEGLGYEGREEGVTAYAVAMLIESPKQGS